MGRLTVDSITTTRFQSWPTVPFASPARLGSMRNTSSVIRMRLRCSPRHSLTSSRLSLKLLRQTSYLDLFRKAQVIRGSPTQRSCLGVNDDELREVHADGAGGSNLLHQQRVGAGGNTDAAVGSAS